MHAQYLNFFLHFSFIIYGFRILNLPHRTLLHIWAAVNHKHDIDSLCHLHMLLSMASTRSKTPNHHVLILQHEKIQIILISYICQTIQCTFGHIKLRMLPQTKSFGMFSVSRNLKINLSNICMKSV